MCSDREECALVGRSSNRWSLEPVGMNPVIIEDDCFIGAGVVIVEGILVRSKAVIAPGVVLSKSIPVYDAVKEEIRERGSEIPEGAVVIPGSRPVNSRLGKETRSKYGLPDYSEIPR